MESYERDLISQEEKEERDRIQHQEILADTVQAFEDVICEANKNDVDLDDLLECIVKAVYNADDTNIKIIKE